VHCPSINRRDLGLVYIEIFPATVYTHPMYSVNTFLLLSQLLTGPVVISRDSLSIPEDTLHIPAFSLGRLCQIVPNCVCSQLPGCHSTCFLQKRQALQDNPNGEAIAILPIRVQIWLQIRGPVLTRVLCRCTLASGAPPIVKRPALTPKAPY
jgi:hypothetical protein